MSLVQEPAAILSYRIRDESGSESSFRMHVPAGAVIADVWAAAAIVAPLVAAVTDGVIVGQELSLAYQETAPGTPAAGSRVERKGVVTFVLANARKTLVTIPAVKSSLVLPSGALDRSNAAFLALTTGIIGSDMWVGADGSDITGLYKAQERFRKTTKRQAPTAG